MTLSNCVNGVERRGNVYYLRWRVPAEFRDVEKRPEINHSLKTKDFEEAKAIAFLKKLALRKVWKARLVNERQGPTVEAFEASIALLEEFQLPYVPIGGLVAGPLEDLVSRIEKLAQIEVDSPVVPAALGACEVPHIPVLDMPSIMEERNAHKVKGMHHVQLRQWRNRYKHAARIFSEIVSNKSIHEITEDDARQ